MRSFWWDGFFAESSELIWLQYFSLYAVALGAGLGLVGVLSAMGYLLAALSMWPGALFAERTRRYKFIVLLTGGGLGRVMFLVLAVIPWIATGDQALGLLIVVAAVRGFLASVAMPAWSAFAAEFVPAHLRGRYFASRNFARQLAEFSAAPMIGGLIYGLGGLSGWQTAWLIAFLLGMAASSFYMRIPSEGSFQRVEPRPASRKGRAALRDRRLVSLVATTAALQLSVMLAAPFFAIYLVQELGGTTLWVGITTAAMPVGGIVAQAVLGRLNDRVGPKTLLVGSGLLMPLLPWLWILASAPWQVIFINLLGGMLWSANLLGTFNLVLTIAPADRRPTYSAMQQAGLFLAGFVGPLIGGFLIPAVGYHTVFFLSGAGRGVATLLLWRFVHIDEDQAEPDLDVGPAAEPATAAA